MQEKRKVIIADDNENILQTVKDILTDAGYEAETVHDGFELLSRLKIKVFDLVILDLIMPEKDGVAIFSAIRSMAPKTKVIVYTGFAKYQDSAFAKSADYFLLKGGNPLELLEAIKKLTHQ